MRRTGLGADEVARTLVELELEGRVVVRDGMYRRRFVNPYWLEEPTRARPETKLDGRVDVAIVGAGVTGCSAALRLADGGLRVRVHDARGIAEGASGRNGGFALRRRRRPLRRRARDVRCGARGGLLALDT